jgi:hypothetical protein
LLAFDFTSLPAYLVYLASPAAAYLFWRTVGRALWEDYHSVRRRVQPPSVEPPKTPDVIIDRLASSHSTTPLNELDEGQKKKVEHVYARFQIENKGRPSIRNVTLGARHRDGREHRFPAFDAPLLVGRETGYLHTGPIPKDWLDESVPTQSPQTAFLYWVRFDYDGDGKRWEALYDPQTRKHTYTLACEHT